jgi:hypothetical protein
LSRSAERLDSAHLSGNQDRPTIVKSARFGPRGGTLLLEVLARGMEPRRRGLQRNGIMKKQSPKITLARETLRLLDRSEAAAAEGGTFPNTQFNSCHCPTLSCKPAIC